MILVEEARWLREAAHLRLVSPEQLVAWADSWITALDHPPYWLIEISTARAREIAEHMTYLSGASGASLRASQSISLVISFHQHRHIDLEFALLKIFGIWLKASRVAPDDMEDPEDHMSLGSGPLPDLLVEWDCRDDAGCPPADFQARCLVGFEKHVERHGAAPKFRFPFQ